ncbi:MAG: GNAT family N-acetyltransferase [Sphingobacterium sp.]|uniref:GNAT family N-acetyltransferase n=1 Tax=Sphingobacterium sp. JB170 TaxID=1434842 RepID=UPI00097F0B9F|nr:GNAT family N-acetyltransferase [Sphingobacterium sp. JB170]SJN37501.1 GCN5-related N-acetyltransferase [Sphingobacterium sp. JB170]
MVTIRKARKDDCTAMMDLIHELAEFVKAPQDVTVSMEEFENSGFGDHPVWGAWLAERDGVILGMSLYYIRYSTWKGRRLYLEDLIVTQSERGNGIGGKLLTHTINFAKEQGFSGMMWQVLDWNEAAIGFYKKYQAEFETQWLNVTLNFDK